MLTPDDFHTPAFRKIAGMAQGHLQALEADALKLNAADPAVVIRLAQLQGQAEGMRVLVDRIKEYEKEMMGLAKG